jgi:GNAT superfamily N-acetyltransferase
MTTDITIDEIPLPESLDGPGADDFRTAVAIRNAIAVAALGPAAGTDTPEEVLPSLHDQQHDHKRLFVARDAGDVVAFAIMVWAVDPETRVTWMETGVRPDRQRHGIGTALHDRLEGIARESGRPFVQGGAFHLPVEGPRLESPTGFGSISREDASARFLLKRGYTLEQVYRYSVLHLPIERAILDVHLAAAQAKAGSDYRVHTWTHRTPDLWLDGVAEINMRMATDAPAGNLEIEEEPWDAERVRQHDELRLASGRTLLAAAVEHVPSGTLVAFNGLTVPDDRTRPVHQGITLVLKEHRGHRLGMLTKIANIQQLQAFSPESPFIMTDNAEENRPMLDVNEAVGFVPIAYEGAWKKTFA